jgi:iron complex outermembrane receptor protein
MRKNAVLCYLLVQVLWQIQAQQINGIVTDADGQPLVGAHVGLAGTYQGVFTKTDGSFEIKVGPLPAASVFAGFLGFKSDTVLWTAQSSQPLYFKLERKPMLADEVVVIGTRAGDNTPMARTNLSREDIEKNNQGQDMPYVLRLTPSLVTTSDAGAGIGYTGLRIRGSDATRINVTINGIPLNDAESQGVFWVNMPDFTSSTDAIQIQRGVGTSTNGAAAFGGTVNLQTNELKTEPYAEVKGGAGSFDTYLGSLRFGTGLISKHFSVDGRLSQIQSAGYIDRASSDLQSYYLSGAYNSAKTSLRFITFSGLEKTYQAWYGVPGRLLDTARTYNPYDYPDETDNYRQSHYQLLMARQISKKWVANINLHYTKGAGYYTQYKGDKYNFWSGNAGAKQPLSEYGAAPIIYGLDTITHTNLIRRRWLDNDFAGIVYSLQYSSASRWQLVWGGGANRYAGRHYGEVMWAEHAERLPQGHIYYDNDAVKTDVNTYLKANWQVRPRWNLYGDLEWRMVGYSFEGIDPVGKPIRQTDDMNFINPKGGFTWRPALGGEGFASVSVAHREPNRNDYTENTIANRPLPERLLDYEAGYRRAWSRVQTEVNFYYMDYYDQLVLTGALNDVGASKRVNVPRSYRAGIEIMAAWKPWYRLEYTTALTLSRNEILNFTSYTDNWATGMQTQQTHSGTDLAFSPSVIANQSLSFNWLKRNRHNANIALLSNAVGRQFLDNTSNTARVLPAYAVLDFRADYTLKGLLGKELGVSLLVQNVLNTLYVSNGWVYAFQSPAAYINPGDPYIQHEGGETWNMTGYFPNASINAMVNFWLKL